MSTASDRSAPGFWLIKASVPSRAGSRLRRGLSRTIRKTGIVAMSRRMPPPRKTSLSPKAAPANPPMTGPMAPPNATADVTTPSAQPTRLRGVSTATSAVAAATVPLVAPCRKRRTTSWPGFWTKAMSPTVMAPPSIDRTSIGLRPNRSPRTPQIGLAIAIESPDTLPAAAVQRSRSRPWCTPRFWEMKIERNGKAKLNPKMAVNSANQSAARLRRQSTTDVPSPLEGRSGREDGVPKGGSVPRAQHLDDPIWSDRQPVDDRLRIPFAQSVLDRVGDCGRDRDRPALARALEPFGVGIGWRLHVDQLWEDRHLARADNRVVEQACSSEGSVRLVHGRLVKRVHDAMCVAAVHLALDQPAVDGLACVVRDDVPHNFDVACFRVYRNDCCVAAAGEREWAGGVEALEHLQTFVGDDVSGGDSF